MRFLRFLQLLLPAFAAALSSAAASVSVAEWTAPVNTRADAHERVEQVTAALRRCLAACKYMNHGLPDAPGAAAHHILSALDKMWSSYIVVMREFGHVSKSRAWASQVDEPVSIWGREYYFEGLPLPDERTHSAPRLLAELIATIEAESEDSQREHLESIKALPPEDSLEEEPNWDEPTL